MGLKLYEFFIALGFTSFVSIVGVFSDIAIVALTVYTLYITVFCKKIKLITVSKKSSTFYGDSISLTFMNKSLHTIPIKDVFIMKRIDNVFYKLEISRFDEPISLPGWSMKKIETSPFTSIGLDIVKDSGGDYSDIYKDSMICIGAGSHLIWVKPFSKAPVKEAKKSLSNHDYRLVTVVRFEMNNTVLSEAVDCCIQLRIKDLNGYKCLKVLYGITGYDEGRSVLLSDVIMGYNSIPYYDSTPESISKTIQEICKISENDISVSAGLI